MNVALFIDSLGNGGSQRQIICLASVLGNKYNVKLFHYGKEGGFYESEIINKKISVERLKCKNKVSRFFVARKAFDQFKADVVIAYLDRPGIIASINKIFGSKWKLIVSDRNTTQSLSSLEKIKFFTYRWADFIVPNSQTQGDFILTHYSNLSSKIRVITNFVDVERFKSYRTNHSFPDENEHINIICVGRICPQKNVLLFIQAVKIIRDRGVSIHVDWFGKTEHDKEYVQEADLLIREYQLSDYITFHDPQNNIEKYYSEADVFCLPSIFEGFPNVLCEAMACELPVLVSSVCDNPYIVEDGCGFLFDPLDVNSIAKAIISYHKLSSSEKRKMGENGRKVMLNNYSTDVFKQKYIQLIEQ